MGSFKLRRGYGLQKEGYVVGHNGPRCYLTMVDLPFETGPRFRESMAEEMRDVGQIVNIRPVGELLTWSLLNREIGKRKLNLVNYDKMNDKNLESDKITLENLQDIKEEVALGKSKMIKFSLTYLLTLESGKIDSVKRKMILRLKSMGVKTRNKRFSDVKVRERTLRGEIEGIYVNPESASYLTPVNRGYLLHDKGTYYGICEISKTPVFLERSHYTSSHELVLGMTGSGKSFFVKTTMFREKFARGSTIKIIDPLGEYRELSDSIGAKSIDLLNQQMNVFEKMEFLTIKENVDRAMALLVTLFNLQNQDKGIVDTALTLMYENNESLAFMKDYIKSQSTDTYNRISPIFEGSLKSFSVGHNPSLSGDLRINLANVPKKLLSFYMLLSLDLIIRSRMDESTNVVIDEAHYLLEEGSAQSLERYVRHARHSKTSIILISQSSNDFFKNGNAMTIMENCSIHVLFRHQAVSEEMKEFYVLDEGLSDFLINEAGFNGKYSLGLFYCPGFKTVLRVHSNEQEMFKINGISES